MTNASSIHTSPGTMEHGPPPRMDGGSGQVQPELARRSPTSTPTFSRIGVARALPADPCRGFGSPALSTGPDLRFLFMNASTIVGFHASCHPEQRQPVGSWSFEVLEFAVLASGDRILLRRLGWASSGHSLPSAEDALVTMRQVLLPDEDSPEDGDHPWATIKAAAAERGLLTTERIEGLPYTYSVDASFIRAPSSG